jgi:hypothetical protein
VIIEPAIAALKFRLNFGRHISAPSPHRFFCGIRALTRMNTSSWLACARSRVHQSDKCVDVEKRREGISWIVGQGCPYLVARDSNSCRGLRNPQSRFRICDQLGTLSVALLGCEDDGLAFHLAGELCAGLQSQSDPCLLGQHHLAFAR